MIIYSIWLIINERLIIDKFANGGKTVKIDEALEASLQAELPLDLLHSGRVKQGVGEWGEARDAPSYYQN